MGVSSRPMSAWSWRLPDDRHHRLDHGRGGARLQPVPRLPHRPILPPVLLPRLWVARDRGPDRLRARHRLRAHDRDARALGRAARPGALPDRARRCGGRLPFHDARCRGPRDRRCRLDHVPLLRRADRPLCRTRTVLMHPNLKAALDPASVALIGASENPNKIGGRPLDYLRRFGFRGAIYPINPKRAEVQGVKAVPRLADLDRAPDAAIIAVPGDAAVRALDECGAMGVKVAVMMTSGFGETGPEGKAAERAMVARARAHGMRMIGPNTQGLANFGTGAVLSFSSMFLEE